ncbi:hypothetical protein RB653_001929 [Dictyostelium firmibasis]|uniref:VWFA domain-containing protein n=1 Tax=Dictyostelium firmibasis TaxID=79012 RepID=A0AAN7TN06_9MYCE
MEPLPIQSNLTIHELSVNLFEPVITEENDKKVASIDGILKATIQIPVQSIKRKLLLIVIVDKSRSIQTAWFQIQSTLLNLFSMISNVNQEIILEILFFNNTCYRLQYTKDNFRELILNEKPNGKTCFASAFSMTEDTIRQYYKVGSVFKSDKNFDAQTDTAIVLLTDGSHTTTRDHKAAFKSLRNTIDLVNNASIVVSTMGFTPNSRFNDLDGIRRLLGNSPGIYQYSDPSDGAFALQEKLTFILKYVLNSSNTFNLNIKLETIYNNNNNNNNTTTDSNIDNQKSVLTFNNETIKSSIKSNYQLTLDQFGVGEISLGINSTGYNISEILIHFDINGDNRLRESKSIKPTIKNDKSEESKYYTILIGLDSKISCLLQDIERFNATNKPSEKEKSDYLKQIIQYQSKLSEIDNFKLFRIKSTNRSELVELKQQCLTMTTQLLDLINSWDRSEWSTTSNARVADITYRYLFKNTGRQRRMNLKVARNSSNIKADANKFKDLEVNMEEFEELENLADGEKQSQYLEASKQLFTDVLSLSDWTEALEEKDVMGFGLSIQRPESVVDDPTQIRIQDISTTFICKSSIEDAIALSLVVHGQEKTTGGFEVGYDKQSVAVRGRGREAINSFLPLYLHKEHWKPIKYQLKNIIAYFVTLDPLAFSYDQINALFLVVGTLISKNEIGERDLLLAIQFTRTLRAIADHLNFIPRMLQQLDAIVNNPIYLISAQPKNLFVLTSYLLVLTDKELESVFKNGSKDHFKLWQNILESSIRRACYTYFDKMEQTKIDSFLFQILFGSKDENEKIKEIDEKPIVEKEEKQPNQLFDLLLNYQFEPIKFEEQEDYGKLLNIKKKTFSDDDVNESSRGIKKTNETMVESMIKISNLLENRGYPNITALFNSLRYVKTWRSIYKDEDNIFDVIDSRYGIPPTEYIEIMKNGTRSTTTIKNNGIGNFIYTINKFYGTDLNLSEETLLNHLRAMIVQAVSYRINRHATFAVVEKKLETSVYDNHVKCISNITSDLMHRAADAIRSMKAILMFSATMNKAAKSTSMEEFMTTVPEHNRPFFPKFALSLMGFGNNEFGELKFVVFLSNIYVTCDDYGNIATKKIVNFTWHWGKSFYKRMVKSLGLNTTKKIVQKVFYHIYLHEKRSLIQNDDGTWENN